MKKAICVLFSLMLVLSMALPGFADDTGSKANITTSNEKGVGVGTMPVEIILKGGEHIPKTDETYTIAVEPQDDNIPWPVGADGILYQFTITGANKGEFKITFDELGDYQYKVWQQKGKNKLCTYDQTAWLVTFQVRNTMMEDGITIDTDKGYTVYAIAQPLKSEKTDDGTEVLTPGDKSDLVFTNKYRSNSPATGDTSNPMLYVTMVGLGLAVAVVLLVTRKPKEIED